MIQVYDLQGKLQNVICLGKDGDNNEKQFRKLLDRKIMWVIFNAMQLLIMLIFVVV